MVTTPTKWRQCPLKEIVAHLIDNRGKTPPLEKNGPHELLEVSAITSPSIYPDYSRVRKRISQETYDTWFKRGPLHKGDILISTVGSVANIAYSRETRATIAQNIIAIRTKPIMNPLFLYYYLSAAFTARKIRVLDIGCVQASIKVSDLMSIPIHVPPLPEQEKIAHQLFSFDKAIIDLREQNKALVALSIIYYRLLSLHPSKETCTLQEICTHIAGGGTPPKKEETHYNGTIDWYTTKELQDGFLYTSKTKITESGLQSTTVALFPPKSILIAMYAFPTAGRLGILNSEGAFNQATCGLVPNSNTTYEYLYCHLKSHRANINQMASGSAQQNLSKHIIKKYPAFTVDAEALSDFKRSVGPLFQKIEINTRKIKTLTDLRNALTKKFMCHPH